jgi:hypothetical protein
MKCVIASMRPMMDVVVVVVVEQSKNWMDGSGWYSLIKESA